MSDNIPPFDLQIEIIKKVSSVKSLVRFRSVSKPLKSFIDSSQFIKAYKARHTQPHTHILILRNQGINRRFICLVDDDKQTYKVQQQEFAPFVVSPLLKGFGVTNIVGASHGLVCFYGFHRGYMERMLVIWNPSIGKSFGISEPIGNFPQTVYGFGVCPVNKDPTAVKIKHKRGMPWHVEVFTLSLGVWNVIPSGNLPRQSIRLDPVAQVVVIDRFIYWSGDEETITYDGYRTRSSRVVSFDLITKEFNLVDLPDSLTNKLDGHVSLSKLRESLVVYGNIKGAGVPCCCGAWVMDRDSSFRKLFSVGMPYKSYYKILGFSKNSEPIFDIRKEGDGPFSTLNVYDPSSKRVKNLGIYGDGSSFMGSYKESLLLLDQSDSRIY